MHPELYRAINRARICPQPAPLPQPASLSVVDCTQRAVCRWPTIKFTGVHRPARFETLTEKIKRAVANFYGVTIVAMDGSQRTYAIIRPRHVAFYLLAKHTLLSLPQIGRLCGKRDHTTVLHARNKITRQQAADGQLADEIAAIEREIGVS